jgi:hypothetical protein
MYRKMKSARANVAMTAVARMGYSGFQLKMNSSAQMMRMRRPEKIHHTGPTISPLPGAVAPQEPPAGVCRGSPVFRSLRRAGSPAQERVGS